ncbi:MAG TPA: hypothetical protein VJ508_12860, partial [Saprospiraceae bacterium]|nr:hypothetical protein [Saprospiraceae bacterium]
VYDVNYCEGEAQAFSLAAPVYDVVWNFGDPSSGLQNNASSDTVYHTFDIPGLYNITVTGRDIYGCPGEAVLSSNIQPNTLTGIIDVQPTGVLCYGDTATLTAPSGGTAWIWSNDVTTSQTVVGATGSYSVLMQDQYHCSYAPPPVYVSILPKPTITVEAREITGANEYGPWQNPLVICAGTEFQIQVFGAGNLTYHWSDGSSGNILTFTSEGGNLPMEGHYTYEVYGDLLPYPCLSDTAAAVIDIIGLPDVPLIALTGGSGCALDNNTLQVTNPQAGIEYQWSDGQMGTSITTRVAGTYLVIAMNANGCTRQSATIEIKASAPVDLIPGGCFIECDPLTVCLPLLTDVSSYTLFQNGVPVQSGTTWPSDFMVTQDGSYYFEVINSAGCKVTSDPLNLELYPGVGSITVITYLDTDGDGIISGGDTQLPGIPVQIESASGINQGSTYTGNGGDFVFENYPLDTYTASFDLTLLSSQYKILIDSVSTSIAACNDSVVVALLLTNNCSVSGPDQLLHLCPGDMVSIGDSVWTDTGSYIMHLPSTGGCDSVFQVNIFLPDSIVIGATVWVDVDQNGILSPADTTLQGITVMVDQLINSAPFLLVTGANGSVSGTYPSGQFLVSVDSAGLPGELNVIYGAEYVPDTICGLADINFLLVASCVNVIQVEQDTICPGDSVFVQGQWIYAGGLYSYVLSDPSSFCDTTLDVNISISNPIAVQADVDWNCNQLGHILLHVLGDTPFTYDWNSGGNADTLLTGLQDGMYAVLITDANGCSVEDTFMITSPAPLDFQVGGPYTVHEGDSVMVDVTGDILTPGLT